MDVRGSECGLEQILHLIRNVGLEATVSVCTPRNVVSLSTTTANFNQKEKGQKITLKKNRKIEEKEKMKKKCTDNKKQKRAQNLFVVVLFLVCSL